MSKNFSNFFRMVSEFTIYYIKLLGQRIYDRNGLRNFFIKKKCDLFKKSSKNWVFWLRFARFIEDETREFRSDPVFVKIYRNIVRTSHTWPVCDTWNWPETKNIISRKFSKTVYSFPRSVPNHEVILAPLVYKQDETKIVL